MIKMRMIVILEEISDQDLDPDHDRDPEIGTIIIKEEKEEIEIRMIKMKMIVIVEEIVDQDRDPDHDPDPETRIIIIKEEVEEEIGIRMKEKM